MQHRLALVPNLHIGDVWMKVLPHFLNGKECWEQFYSIQQIKKNLLNGLQQLWIMIEDKKVLGVVLTQLDDFPEKRILRITYLGGKGFKPSMMDTLSSIEEWGKSKGCVLEDIFGRDKWEPLLKKRGFKSAGKIYRKEL